MEFLVRLKDKVNIQVFCLNPVHKGEHMDRVVYEDNTFEAPCPECGSIEYLYRKNNAITKKGHFITFKPDGWTWGRNERKHYGVIRIDCTYEQAKEYCEGIRNKQAEADVITYDEQANNRKNIIINNIRESLPTPMSEDSTLIEKLSFLAAIKEALESDAEYQAATQNSRQAENKANIDKRPRKFSFDFEKVLTTRQLKKWNDGEKYSDVVTTSDKTQIKEM